jgi:hypothetical protein
MDRIGPMRLSVESGDGPTGSSAMAGEARVSPKAVNFPRIIVFIGKTSTLERQAIIFANLKRTNHVVCRGSG